MGGAILDWLIKKWLLSWYLSWESYPTALHTEFEFEKNKLYRQTSSLHPEESCSMSQSQNILYLAVGFRFPVEYSIYGLSPIIWSRKAYIKVYGQRNIFVYDIFSQYYKDLMYIFEQLLCSKTLYYGFTIEINIISVFRFLSI